MLYSCTAKLLLLVYGAIALAGQGLHGLMHAEHGHCTTKVSAASADSHAGCSHGKSKCGHRHHVEQKTVVAKPRATGLQVGLPASHGCHHDHATCGICQHHSLGQMLAVTPPALAGETDCERRHISLPSVVVSGDRHSSAQPRAPPAHG